MAAIEDIFANGSRWLRAGFHLHSGADKEFRYDGDDNYYYSSYVDALETAGIHIGLIANHNKFDPDEWLANGQDHINPFLTAIFAGKTPDQYENKNDRSSFNLIETIRKLEGYHKDFFLIFAHVDERSGLWNELDGGRLKEIGKTEYFRRRSLAFQKMQDP